MITLREAFVEALQAAEYDIALERAGYQIYHFFDSDILYRIILGYRDPQNRSLLLSTADPPDIETEAGRRLILSALVGHNIGVPPLLRALPPHLHEVRILAESGPWRNNASGYRDTVAQLRLQPLLRELNQLIGEQRIPALLQHFLDDGPTIFYGVDLLRGTWASRFRHLIELGIHRDTPFDSEPEIVGTDTFTEMTRYVASDSATKRQNSTVAGLRDAMALAVLARAIDGKQKGVEAPLGTQGAPLARFYTETSRIHLSWRQDPKFRSRLTYPDLLPTYSASSLARSVMRNDCYYLVRALIAPFGYDRHRVEGQEELLETSAKRLREGGELASAGELPSGSAVATRDQKSLEFYMKQLTQLSSYNTAWRQLIDRVEERVPGDLEVEFQRVLAGHRTHERGLGTEHNRLMSELAVATESVQQFTVLYQDLIRVLDSSRDVEQLRPRAGLSYLEHSGLRRWGFDEKDLPEAVLKQAIDAFEDWLGSEDPDRDASGQEQAPKAAFAVDVTLRVIALRDGPLATYSELAEHLGLIGFLCMIRAFDIVEYWGDLFLYRIRECLVEISVNDATATELTANDLARVGAAVQNKVLVTRLRSRLQHAASSGPLTPELVSNLVTAAQQDIETLERLVRFDSFEYRGEAIALTKAYILFHTWLTINGSLLEMPKSARKHVRGLTLAEQSFEICSRALENSAPDHPNYPFLLNYCVYVGAARLHLTGTDILERSDLPDRLIGLTRQGVWSYRFHDTLGYLNYVRSARALELYIAIPRDEDLFNLARSLSRSAASSFEQIEHSVRDPEVTAHQAWLAELLVEIEAEQRRLANRA